LGDQIENNEKGRACSMYGREKRCIKGCGGEAWGEDPTWKTEA